MNQSIAKGTLYLGMAQLLFLISSYAIHIGLGRMLGPELYGMYAVVVSLVTVVNLILTTGIPRTVSKFTSERPDLAKSILKTAGKLQLCLSLLIFALYFILASFLAEILKDCSLTTLIRVSSIMIPIYAIFSLYTGYFNGLRDYRNQSVISAVYSISKIALIFGLVLMGFSVFGAVLGFAISPAAGLLIAVAIASFPIRTSEYIGYSKIIKFALPVIVLSVLLNFSTSVDLLVLKAIVRDSQEVGYYSAASMISKVPFTLLGALNMALFPAVSSLTYLNDLQKTREYIQESFRYLLIFLVPATAFIFVTATEFISLLYSPKYVEGGEPLRVLIIGILFFSVFAYFLNIVVASGKASLAAGFSVFISVLSAILNFTFIPVFGMTGAAIAVTIASFISMLAILTFVIMEFGSVIPLKSLAKVILSTIAAASALYFRCSGPLLLGQYIVAFVAYFALLWAVREINERDVIRLKRLMFRRGS